MTSAARQYPDRPHLGVSVADVEALFDLPFMDLLFRAQQVHREHFDASELQLSTLLSIKTGGCPEDCAYCPQAARYATGVKALDAGIITGSLKPDDIGNGREHLREVA